MSPNIGTNVVTVQVSTMKKYAVFPNQRRQRIRKGSARMK
jgi:hypothetical protein